MNSLDTLSLFIGLTFLALGFYNGLIKSVSSLIAIIAGMYCAKKLEPFISKLLSVAHIKNPEGVLGYIFVFFCIFVSVKILLLLVQKVTKASGLSIVDRIFGGVLGAVKGILVIVIACTVLQVALPRNSAIFRSSKFLPYINKAVSTAHVFLPNDMYKYIMKGKRAPRA